MQELPNRERRDVVLPHQLRALHDDRDSGWVNIELHTFPLQPTITSDSPLINPVMPTATCTGAADHDAADRIAM